MRSRTLLILSLFVAGLGAFIWLFERDLPSSDERAERAGRLVQVDGDEVVALTVEMGSQKLRLERSASTDEDAKDGSQWRLVEPLSARADASLADGLVRQLVELEQVRIVEDIDLASAGLVSPRAQVRMETDRGEYQLRIGNEVPASSAMMVAVGDSDTVVVVSNSVWSDLTRVPGDWRSKDVFAASAEQIQSVTFEHAGARTVLSRRDGGFWLDVPVADRADDDKVHALLTELAGLQVSEFVDSPGSDSELGLTVPSAIIELDVVGTDEPLRLELGGPTSEEDTRVYARAEGQRFRLESTLDEALARSLSEWRSAQLSHLEVYQINGGVFAGTGGEVSIARDGGDWRRGADKIDFGPATDVLYALTGAEASEILDRPAASERGLPGAEPELSVTLTTKEGGTETINLYPGVESGVPVENAARDVVLMLSAETAEDILGKLESLRLAEAQAEGEADPPTTPDSGTG